MDDEITIKIQTLDNIYPLTLKRLSTVIELQEKISENFNIPINNQRLIFQGKYLQSSTEKLKSYKIQNESVIHLLIKQNNTNTNNTTNTEENNNINININNIQEENNSFNIIHNNIPFISLNRRNNPRHSRRHNMHFDPSDCIESLYQNILTINNLIQCKNTFDYSHILNSKTIKPFNFKKRKFEIGEWIDVRDTIDNWLEAQIVNIRNNVNGTKEVLVHYNGWGNRWNEWININSKRISHFKNYTLQNQNSILLSPNPTVNTDGYLNFNENNTQPNRPIDVFFYFDKINGIMNEINKMLEKMKVLKKKQNNNINPNNIIEDDNNNINTNSNNNNNNSNNNNNNNNDHSLNLNNLIPFSMNETEILLIISQIIPILDRSGRLMADLSLLLSHCVLNPNLYPKLLFGHNLNEVSDSISCTSGYSMITNESSSIYSGLTNNLRFLQEQNVITNLQSNRNQNNNNINNNLNNNNLNNNNNNNNNVISSNINNNSNNNNINNNINRTNSNNNTVYSIPHYFLNNNNYELPFIQRLNYNNNLHINAFNNINNNNNNININTNNITNIYDSFPKIILQVPPLLSPNEFNLVNNYNPIDEQNIYLIGHNVFVDNSNNITNTQNITRINNNNINFNNNNNIINNINNNNNNNNNINNNNNNNNINNINNNINININNNISNNSNTIINNNNNIINNNIINNNINNINITEITENTNTINLEEDTNRINSNSLNNTFFKTNYSQKRRNTSVASSHSNKSADQILYTKKFNYHLIKELKENEKDDYNINLLKNLNKENYDNYYIENISLKSDKNTSIKNKNLSYKSVSEVDEFGEYDEEDKKKENNMLNSVNRSIESFENEVNISYGNISNTNSISTQKEFLKENNTIQELTEDNENINENKENNNNNNKSNKNEKK